MPMRRDESTPRRRRGRARRYTLLAAALALVTGAPGTGIADHTQCDGDGTPQCPSFSPGFLMDLTSEGQAPGTGVVDIPTDLFFGFTQNDHELPVAEIDYLVPAGWHFGLDRLQNDGAAGQKPNGSRATTCSDMYDFQGARRFLKRGERLSNGPGPRAGFRTGSDRSLTMIEGTGPNAQGPGDPNRNDVSFLDWSARSGIARLCLHIAPSADTPDLLLPMELIRIDPGHPLGEDFGWIVRIDESPIFRDPGLFNDEVSVIRQEMNIRGKSAGNWHRDPVTGQQEPVVFSRSPERGVNGVVGAVATGCARGINQPGTEPICRGGEMIEVSASKIVPITPAAAGEVRDFAMLTGPATIPGFGPGLAGGVPTPEYNGYGLVVSTDTAVFTWDQPGAKEGVPPVKGYVLVIAKPGDQDSRVFVRIVSAPGPDQDPSKPCGETGDEFMCSVPLTFPLTGIGGTMLEGDHTSQDQGLYDAVLVTIWVDGRRSDGLCDDGTPYGTLCDPTTVPPRILAPEVSYFRFQMRSGWWPMAFVQAGGTGPKPVGNSGPCLSACPRYTLLVNQPLHRAQFIVWTDDFCIPHQDALDNQPPNPCLDGAGVPLGDVGGLRDVYAGLGIRSIPHGTYAGAHILIQGDGTNGSVVFEGNAPSGESFRFDGAVARNRGAGVFTLYSLRNLSLTPPSANGTPTAHHIVFNGARVV